MFIVEGLRNSKALPESLDTSDIISMGLKVTDSLPSSREQGFSSKVTDSLQASRRDSENILGFGQKSRIACRPLAGAFNSLLIVLVRSFGEPAVRTSIINRVLGRKSRIACRL